MNQIPITAFGNQLCGIVQEYFQDDDIVFYLEVKMYPFFHNQPFMGAEQNHVVIDH